MCAQVYLGGKLNMPAPKEGCSEVGDGLDSGPVDDHDFCAASIWIHCRHHCRTRHCSRLVTNIQFAVCHCTLVALWSWCVIAEHDGVTGAACCCVWGGHENQGRKTSLPLLYQLPEWSGSVEMNGRFNGMHTPKLVIVMLCLGFTILIIVFDRHLALHRLFDLYLTP